MKTSLPTDLELPPSLSEKLQTVVAFHDLSFSDLAAKVGLDPSKDFRHANLAKVDFSGSNLSGFDFTGTDLRGSFGTNIQLDACTNFTRADVDLSVFEMEAIRRREFKLKPYLAHDYQRIRGKYWTDAANLIIDRVLEKKHDELENWAILTQYFNEESAARPTLLLAASKARLDQERFLSFIIHLCSGVGTSSSVIVEAIAILGRLFPRRAIARDMMLAHASNVSHTVRMRVLTGLLTKSADSTTIRQLANLQKAETFGPNRRVFVGLMSNILKHRRNIDYCHLFHEPYREGVFLDWQNPLYPTTVAKLISHSAEMLDSLAFRDGNKRNAVTGKVINLAERRRKVFSDLLNEAVDFGIPFKATPDPIDRVY